MKKFNFKKLKKIFIIAEIGNNHEGNYKIARKLIKLAAKAGVDAVKFQTFKVEEFINQKDQKRFKQIKKFQLNFKQFKNLRKLANEHKLKFISTPLDFESSNFLLKNSDIIKIASSDNNFFPLIDNIVQYKKPIIISTGLLNLRQILYLKNKIKKKTDKKTMKENISFLHCVTNYPVNINYANLNSIKILIDKLDQCIGYSDHTVGKEACLVAASLGAKIIEKHFTLDKKFSNFRDHSISADYKELKEIVTSVRKIEKLMGKNNKEIQECEKSFLKIVRRMPFAKKDIQKEERISFSNVSFLRSNKSKSFFDLENIIGKKTKNKIIKNQLIDLRNLK